MIIKKIIKMKRFILGLSLALIIIAGSAKAQTSNWYGEIKVQGTTLPITLEIEKKADTTIILMGSPMQTKEMFPVTKQKITADSILFSIKSMGVVYRGRYNQARTEIRGNFKQGFISTDLNFSIQEEKFEVRRPQEPTKPYPYVEEELSFRTDGVDYEFGGTLTLPSKQGKYPCAILITGSGTQDRNEEIMGHKPFLVIADYLTRNNIAVYRYDDRGWGDTNPEHANANTYDYANDVESAMKMLLNHPNIDGNNIGLIGHSEGGIIASIVGSRNPDLGFIILLAGTGVDGYNVLLEQNKAIFKASKASKFQTKSQLEALAMANTFIERNASEETFQTLMNEYFDNVYSSLSPKKKEEYQFSGLAARNQFISQINLPWTRTFFKLDPRVYLSQLTQPVLSIIGSKDIQVIYKQNMKEIEKAVLSSGNTDFEKYKAKNMNHLFQECKTGNVDEYYEIEQTISPKVLTRILEFIVKHSK